MKKRPYFKTNIAELEAIYAGNSNDRSVLVELSKELAHRSTPKAKALLQKVEKTLIGSPTPGVAPPTVHPSAPATIYPSSGADTPARVAVECNCGESNFVSVLPDILQHLSCAHCKTSYEAVYKHGVMRSKFAAKPTPSSSTPSWVWVLLAAALVVAFFAFK